MNDLLSLAIGCAVIAGVFAVLAVIGYVTGWDQ